ncbi:MAG: glycosyltransferase [Lewinellaceae bacterium]|nr:glycosyltransferase [Lewinellaceae bacterium]
MQNLKANSNTLLISDAHFLEEQAMGGVQICTQEYIQLLRQTGFPLFIHPVHPTRSIAKRILIRLQLDCFQHYDYERIFSEISRLIEEKNIFFLAINQINLAPLAQLVQRSFKDRVKIILLSHGNETGDYLPYLVRSNPNGLGRFLHTYRLGRHLLMESSLYTHSIDLTLCISELEQDINYWLGARKILFIPRTFSPEFLGWSPKRGRVGFVGTLNHFPNSKGLEMVLDALCQRSQQNTGMEFRIVGGGTETGIEFERKYPFVKYLGRLGDEELKNEAATWSIFLNPVFWYSRGASTKLATGINWGLPILSTRQGNRGYSWSKGIIEACESPEDMAAKILSWSSDSSKLSEMAEQTRKVAGSGETLSELAEKLKRELEGL